MNTSTKILISIPEDVTRDLDALVQARRGATLHPVNRSSIARDALAAYLAANPPMPVRSRGGSRAR